MNRPAATIGKVSPSPFGSYSQTFHRLWQGRGLAGGSGPAAQWRGVNQAVISGGNGGLARALRMALDDAAWQVRAPGRSELDVTDGEAVTAYFSGRAVDLLVCAAGVTADGPLARMEPAAWDRVVAVNFEGAARCAAAVIPGMRARGTGHIVFLSSHSACHPPAGQAAYAAAKAALHGLAASLAGRHGSTGIRVNVVLPGFLDTPMTASVTPGRREEVLRSHALGRLNTPAAAASFIRFLHEQLPHTSGQVFQLDSRPSVPFPPS